MKKSLTLLFITLITIGLNAQIDRSQMPQAGPAPEINLQDPQRFELQNGLEVLVVENHKLPRVSIQLRIDNPPVLEGDKDLSHNDVFIQWNGMGDRNLGSPEINRMVSVPWRGVVTGDRWKLNLSPGDQCELYDLNSDPYELNNLFNIQEHRDRIREMSARIRLWQDETGDDMPLPAV